MPGWMRYPKKRAAVFLFLAVLGIATNIYDWNRNRTTPDAPELLTLDEAVERARVQDWLWVELKDAAGLHWDCGTAAVGETTFKWSSYHWMDVVVTAPAQSVVIVVIFGDPILSNELAAAQPVLSGFFMRLDAATYSLRNVEGRLDQYPRSATFVELDTRYTAAGTGMDTGMLVFTIFCLLGSLQGFYAGFILKRKPAPVSEVRDSSIPRSLDRL
jgi:hypothetical protein